MPWLTDAELKDALADLLRQAGGGAALPAAWDSVVTAANNDAEADIRSALGALGYSPAQIERWDRRKTFSRSLGLFRLLSDGGILIDFDPKKIEMLDRRKELSKKADPPFQYTAGGVVEAPAATLTDDPVGGRGVASGRMESAATDRVTMSTEW